MTIKELKSLLEDETLNENMQVRVSLNGIETTQPLLGILYNNPNYPNTIFLGGMDDKNV